MPKPDKYIGRTPIWRPDRIKKWTEQRVRTRSGKMTGYTTEPICDACWRRSRGDKEPHRVAQSIRVEETCYACYSRTDSGIYVRVRGF